MLWLFVRPTGVYLLDLFCSGIHNYLSKRLGAKSNKKCCPTERSVHHIHFDTKMHDILNYLFPK